MTEPLGKIRDRFRQLVESGCYEEAERTLEEYARAVDAALAAADPPGAEAAGTVRSALALLGWAGRAARACRAHDAERLAGLAASRPYRPAGTRPETSFRLEA